ncbi:MAG TPA: hypothetical protein VFW96_11450 [Thermomicrobiales bacterium]|nr:hypothetical protein [Thermomicrobiales bacterium]
MGAVKEFRARVYFLKSEEGGRSLPIVSGYRPVFCLSVTGGDCENFDSSVTLEGDDPALPGEERYARIKIWAPDLPEGVLKPDVAFELSELVKTIGRGTIIEPVVAPSALH